MSSPRYGWWGYVKSMIRKYPVRKETLEAFKGLSSPVLTGLPGGKHRVSRPTENAALRELTPVEQKEFDAVDKAIVFTQKLKTGDERMKVISLVFWKGYTLQNACLKIPCSYDTAQNWHRDFVRKVAENYGLL